ncbi:MAG TPA: protein kinase, partial [Thermoanaerobaculaceae bacterium]|nr:protein kinase [Thermoanaerobaculaceae bacterium]
MSQIILLLDYEPRTVLRVTEALTPLGCEIVAAKDVDAAVNACAKVEPRAVLITSVLPRLKVEDAITQLRARAGLRNTPFLILMSGYTGSDPAADAAELGAQDLIAKPFSNEQLLAQVRALTAKPRAEAAVGSDTKAEMLEALRRSSGLPKKPGTVTSEDLFGDLIADVGEPAPAETKRLPITPVAPPPRPAAKPAPAPEKPRPAARALDTDSAAGRALESTLASIREQPKAARPREETGGASVDRLLTQTLSGLEVKMPAAAQPRPKPAAAPAPAPAANPATSPGVKAPTVAPAPSPGPLPGGTPFGQYELMELIATGGMAEVYKARMKGVEGFQKIVAIKRILPHLTDNDEFVTMFIDEAKLAAQLQQPNIIHIYDLGKIDRSYYIAMEYIDGRDLRSILRTLDEKKARMPLGLALFIASRLAAALDYAHRKKDLQGKAMALVHRDVSPQNVLISYDGDIKLCDFGIVKAASKASHTRAGALKGKLQYMSPEQAWGKDLDLRSDIFSLGLVLYEMLTGRKGFAGDSELSILEQVRAPQLVAPRDIDPAIPPEVERVVLKALKEDRDVRYQTAADMLGDLESILQSLRPSPGASELGSFLSDLVGRERPATAAAGRPAATPSRPAVAPPAKPAKPKPAPVVVVPEPAPIEEAPPPPEAAKRPPMGLIAGIAAVVLAVVAGYLFLGRKQPAGPAAGAAATPAPETVELAKQAAEQEVARQSQALRDRLAADKGAAGAAQTAQAPAGAPVHPAAAVPTPRQRPTQAAAPAQPTPAAAPPAAAAAQPAAAAPQPTA